MAENERQMFKFYRSYFDVLNELPEKNKLEYLLAIIEKQFFGKEPSLTGISKLAYISQKHSIDKQVKGFEDKVGTQLVDNKIQDPAIHPCVGGVIGGTQDPTPQLQIELELKLKRELEEKEKNKKEKKKKEKKIFSPPSIFEFENYFFENGFSKKLAQRAFESYDVADWIDSRGNPVLNWKQKCQNVWFKEENKEKNCAKKENNYGSNQQHPTTKLERIANGAEQILRNRGIDPSSFFQPIKPNG